MPLFIGPRPSAMRATVMRCQGGRPSSASFLQNFDLAVHIDDGRASLKSSGSLQILTLWCCKCLECSSSRHAGSSHTKSCPHCLSKSNRLATWISLSLFNSEALTTGNGNEKLGLSAILFCPQAPSIVSSEIIGVAGDRRVAHVPVNAQISDNCSSGI